MTLFPPQRGIASTANFRGIWYRKDVEGGRPGLFRFRCRAAAVSGPLRWVKSQPCCSGPRPSADLPRCPGAGEAREGQGSSWGLQPSWLLFVFKCVFGSEGAVNRDLPIFRGSPRRAPPLNLSSPLHVSALSLEQPDF